MLSSQPTAPVTITLAPDAQVTTAPTTLTFTPANWNAAQVVTVAAVDDAVMEGPHLGTVSATTASADPNYNAVAVAPVVANITDNDTAGVTVSESGGSTDVVEGGATDTYAVVLTSQPTANVTVSTSGDSQASAAPATLTFTPANWNVAQNVTVSGIPGRHRRGPAHRRDHQHRCLI